jgi:peptidoglycan/xylan/chitin deacetylase (PgdA/CDA1 family)
MKSNKPKGLRNLGVRLSANVLYYSGAVSVFRNVSKWKGKDLRHCKEGVHPFVVLLYHRVNPDEDPFFPAISVEVFEAQMRYLSRNFRVLSLADIIRRIQRGKGVEPLTITITFDDGYRDNYTFAHPILKRYQLPATLFVATGFVGGNKLMWNDRLAWGMKNTDQKRIVCQIGCREIALSLKTQQDKVVSLNVLLEQLKTCSEVEKNEVLEKILVGFRNEKPEPAGLMLNWSELRTMTQEGWDVGSHTVNHLILTKVELSRAAEELSLSKTTIERELQHSVDLCAFPNGKRSDFSPGIIRRAKELGYHGAATTLRGINGPDLDFFGLRRWSVWEKHLPTLACKLSYLYRRGYAYEMDY